MNPGQQQEATEAWNRHQQSVCRPENIPVAWKTSSKAVCGKFPDAQSIKWGSQGPGVD